MVSDNDLARRALDVVSRAEVGVFMTLDPEGYPHGRMMHALPMHGLKELFTLSGDGTRKLADIERCPRVAWLFQSTDDDMVLLKGRADVHHDLTEMREVWDRLAPSARRYAAPPFSDDEHPPLVTIQTHVDRMEIVFPAIGVTIPRDVELSVLGYRPAE